MGSPVRYLMKLYNKLVAIQYGDYTDEFGWISFVRDNAVRIPSLEWLGVG